MQREKRIRSGPLLEADFFPVLSDGRRMPQRAPKTKPSTEAQKKYNQAQAAKKLVHWANANFNETDYLLHPTYKPEDAPQSEEQARRDVQNYFRRVKNHRAGKYKRLEKELASARALLLDIPNNSYIAASIDKLQKELSKLEKPFKYMYAIEKVTYKTGKLCGRINWHFHMFVTGGLSTREMENLWGEGVRVNCNTYQPERFGPEAAARYMSKDPQGFKRFGRSRNLERPDIKVKDGKVSRRTVERMATQRIDDREFWERRYRGYRFVRAYPKYNEYNGHWYLSVIMYRSGGDPPDWNADDWITE